MNLIGKVLRFQFRDVVRNRWMIAYTLVVLALTETLFRLSGDGSRVILSLLNLVLILVPLVALTFGTLYFYNAREFIELLLAQPVGRRALFLGLWGGVVLPLAGGLILGVGVPFVANASLIAIPLKSLLLLLATGSLLTAVFTAIAFLLALHIEDRAKGFGAALVVWLTCSVVYDGLILLLTVVFADYPLETPLLGLVVFNPLDLGRVLLLLDLDVSALMGYTGAVFQRFLGTGLGLSVSVGALLLWVAGPLALAARRFAKKDF